jgi:hypothetical protein
MTERNRSWSMRHLLTFSFTLALAAVDIASVFPLPARGFTKQTDSTRIRLTLDASEADEVLAILALRRDGKPIDDTAWTKLFSTAPYRRLKERQASIARQFHDSTIVLHDEDFKRFVLSGEPLKRYSELKATLERWKEANLYVSAEKVLAYLPDSATIHAKIYPVIKSQKNSFVWEASTDPAIFLYVDPEVSRDKFANTVAHELHHIGLASTNSKYETKISSLPEREHTVADWIGAFGEGMAMLAAAGSPDIHPHATSSAKDRARWDRDMANFRENFESVDSFFEDILSGGLSNQDSIEAKGSSFFGIQGPWYTVGYKMCVMVEKRFGRAALIHTMLDPRTLLVLYNEAAKEQNTNGKGKFPLWPETMLKQIGAKQS